MKKIIQLCFNLFCLLFLSFEIMGQVSDASIKQAKADVTNIDNSLNPYRKFVDNDSIHWLFGGDASLSFRATSLANWAGGGEDQIGVSPVINLFANYKKGKRTFENFATFAYGISKNGERKAVKSDDRLYYTAKVGHQVSAKWAYSAVLSARTQFAPGYRYSGEKITAKVSDFLAPVNMYLSVGLDYKPHKSVSCLLSPVMGRAVFARSDSLDVLASAGLITTEKDASGNEVKVRNHSRYEFGGGALLTFNGNLFENKVSYSSLVELFSNYIEEPQNVDVFWTLTTKILIYKNITADLRLELKYDDDQKTTVKVDNKDEMRGAKVQLKNFLGVGLFYQF